MGYGWNNSGNWRVTDEKNGWKGNLLLDVSEKLYGNRPRTRSMAAPARGELWAL